MSLQSLPFRLQADLPDVLSGNLTLHIIPRPVAEPDLEPSDEIVTTFARAIAAQYFCSSPKPTKIANRSRIRTTSGGYEYVYDVMNVPSASLLVLVALLAQTAHAGDEIDLVRVGIDPQVNPMSSQRHNALWHPDDTLSVSREVPFRVSRPDDFTLGEAVDVRVEFQDDLTPEQAEAVGADLEIWGFLEAMGGFLFDFEEQADFSPEFGQSAHIEPNVIEYTKDVLDSTPRSLNLLINFARGLVRNGLVVRHLEFAQ